MTIYKTLRSSFAALLLISGASIGVQMANADAIDDITKAGVLNVGVFADFPPFSSASADMTLKGYDMDVAQALADALKVKLVPVSGDRTEPHSLFDGASRRPADERRLQQGARTGHRFCSSLCALLYCRHRTEGP